jgi:hypothetical protein
MALALNNPPYGTRDEEVKVRFFLFHFDQPFVCASTRHCPPLFFSSLPLVAVLNTCGEFCLASARMLHHKS